jgi:hypothetical protein
MQHWHKQRVGKQAAQHWGQGQRQHARAPLTTHSWAAPSSGTLKLPNTPSLATLGAASTWSPLATCGQSVQSAQQGAQRCGRGRNNHHALRSAHHLPTP